MNRALLPTIWLLVVAMLAAGLSAISGFGFWGAFLIVAAAILINGWVATLEDDLPGGFNNPDGNCTPRYAIVTRRIIRGLGAVLVLLCALALGFHFLGA